MRVLYTHPRINQELERTLAAQRVNLDTLLERCDIVSIHIPYRPENRHLINRERLATMKPGALLINTARGAIIDEAALVDTLREQRIAAAGLDVYEFEPQVSPGLLELDNVVLLPHLGSATTHTREAMSRLAAENIIAVLAGKPALTPIE